LTETIGPAHPNPGRRRRVAVVVGAGLLILVVAVAALFAVWRAARPGFTEAEADRIVMMTLVRESRASSLVTGTLEFGTVLERENRQSLSVPFVPFDLDIGATRVAVRVPGRVAYGFDVRALSADDIRLAPDGVVEVDLPRLSTFSVEPILERAEVRTDASGWARVDPERGARVTLNALASARGRMREQAERHLAEASEPRINAARAVAHMLEPALIAAGATPAGFRIRVADGEVLEFGNEVELRAD